MVWISSVFMTLASVVLTVFQECESAGDLTVTGADAGVPCEAFRKAQVGVEDYSWNAILYALCGNEVKNEYKFKEALGLSSGNLLPTQFSVPGLEKTTGISYICTSDGSLTYAYAFVNSISNQMGVSGKTGLYTTTVTLNNFKLNFNHIVQVTSATGETPVVNRAGAVVVLYQGPTYFVDIMVEVNNKSPECFVTLIDIHPHSLSAIVPDQVVSDSKLSPKPTDKSASYHKEHLKRTEDETGPHHEPSSQAKNKYSEPKGQSSTDIRNIFHELTADLTESIRSSLVQQAIKTIKENKDTKWMCYREDLEHLTPGTASRDAKYNEHCRST